MELDETLVALGVVGYIVGLVIAGVSDATTINGMLLVTGSMILIALSAPSLGYLVRLKMRKGENLKPSMREHMVMTALGFYVATAALLLLYLEYSIWRPVLIGGSIIVSLLPAFKW